MAKWCIVVLLFAFGPLALAGKVYRCPDGSYQDKPCGQGERVVASNNPRAAPPPDADAACHERGRSAAGLVKRRDKGVTADVVIKEIEASGKPYDQRVDERAFAVKVFQTKGSAEEVSTLVEAECVKDKRDQAAKAAAQAAPAPAPAAAPAAEKPESSAAKQAEDELARTCKQLKADARRSKDAARKGGSAEQMEDLAEQHREIEAQLKELCAS